MNRNRLMRNAEAVGRLALAATVITAAATQWASAFSGPMAYDNSKIETCIEPIRQAPVDRGGSLRYLNDDLDVYVVGSKDISAEFTRCINSIYVERRSLPGQREHDDLLVIPPELSYERFDDEDEDERVDVTRLTTVGGRSYSDAARYLYIDKYKTKFLIDLQAKQYFSLVRIPPQGSIESLGRWNGSITPAKDCKNSYGDPCGTKYNVLRQ